MILYMHDEIDVSRATMMKKEKRGGYEAVEEREEGGGEGRHITSGRNREETPCAPSAPSASSARLDSFNLIVLWRSRDRKRRMNKQ